MTEQPAAKEKEDLVIEKPTDKEKEEPIKVNNSNLVELKNACDDYIQKVDIEMKERLTIHTNTKKYSDIYNITFEFHGSNSSSKTKHKIAKSFGNWFDVNGLLSTEIFERELADGLESVRNGKLHIQ
ncbi:1521_t:CDS:2 [Racocetra fulgida]|uniref:Signal peptidase complex subunit 2 n=1 Tax=Racocetra fulgida TaxID=60492 RepID=A0A9N9C2F0_9GLOM|nr:1521_t:CDS:2 [Racocetra fulgida]